MTHVRHSATTRGQLMRWWGYLLLTTLLAALCVAPRYFAVTDLDASTGALSFRAVMLVGHFTTLSAMFLSPALLACFAWPRPRVVIAVGTACSAGLIVGLLIDTQVFQLYRFHINAGVLNLLLGGAADETFIFPGVMYAQAGLIAAVVAAALSAAAWWWWRYVQRTTAPRWSTRLATTVLFVPLVSFHVVHVWADAVAYEPLLEQTQVLPLRYAATAKRSLRTLGVRVRERPSVPVQLNADHSGLSYPLQPLTCNAPAKPPNIVVVLIDSWRFDAMNAQVTPNIDAFSRRTVRFTDHVSGGNATRIGVFSLFYSVPGTYWHPMLIERQGPVFVDELLQQNYDVQAFRSAPLYSPEFDRTVFARLDTPRMRSDGAEPADWDRDLTSDFISYLDTRNTESPFFALLFYDSPHSFQFPKDYPLPFLPSVDTVNYLKLHNDTDARPYVNRYRNSVHYVDELVGEALRAIQTRGLLDNTIIVVTGDHGQEFNDNARNYWGHGSNFSRFQTAVPFMLYSPSLEPRVVRHRTTHFDVMPTLLRQYLGCSEPFSTYSVGRSLFEAGGREPLLLSEYSDFAIADHDRIAVVRKGGMQIHGLDYSELDGVLDPDVIRAALEQKTRFYKSGLRR